MAKELDESLRVKCFQCKGKGTEVINKQTVSCGACAGKGWI